ncbi:hypothetical protein [Altibacter lentus]|uniref:hypothetical protein n=1 Tax=Altibacter lentus TaxID=1223410 RepID=UPI001362CF73|nr:hypothetical protein [Altibacter lentus]
MEIRVDTNGTIRLVSDKPLSEEIRAKIVKRLENKKETLDQMTADYKSGRFDEIFKTI